MSDGAVAAIIGGSVVLLLSMLFRRTKQTNRWRFSASSPSGRWFIGLSTLVAVLTLVAALISIQHEASTRDVLSALMSLLLLMFVVILIRKGSQNR